MAVEVAAAARQTHSPSQPVPPGQWQQPQVSWQTCRSQVSHKGWGMQVRAPAAGGESRLGGGGDTYLSVLKTPVHLKCATAPNLSQHEH